MDRFAPAPPRPARLVFPVAPKRAVFTPTLNRHPGIKVAGPTILHASVDDRKLRSNARLAIDAFKRSHGLPASGTRSLASVDVSQPNVTGINHWWRYEEGSIPGIGRYMVNLWQQNLLIQSDDMDVPHRGIDLAFRRTYNSYSGHDYAGTDGSAPIGQFGTGWTNTFDAHIAQNSSGGISVYDVDGARYDYSYDVSGNFVPPAGMEGTSLTSDDGSEFFWSKKTGTQYAFYAPYYTGTYAGYSGRLYRISARNRNSYLQFAYSWDGGDASASANLRQTIVTSDSGQQALLQFDDHGGRRLCSFIQFPDTLSTVSYDYDSDGNLISVSKMPNGSNAGARRLESYGGYRTTWMWAAGPRWNASSTEGGYILFHFPATNTPQLAGVGAAGFVNFTPDDGTGALLQSGAATGATVFAFTGFGADPSDTVVSDWAGHYWAQYFDALGRPTTHNVYTGTQWLSATETWDAHNHLTAEVDARGNETDYAYDVHGNTVAVAAPPPTAGAFRPTSLFSYDAYDNVTAYCDPVAAHALGGDWTAPPTAPVPGAAGLCPSTSAAAVRYQWNPVTAEPYGELITATAPATAASAPSGYQRTFSYDAAPQGGTDYGLPTRVSGTAITQTDPTTPSRQPQQTYWYDGNGNVVCYGTGSGQWLATYDTLGRMLSSADPDDTSSGTGMCGKTGAQAGWSTTSRMAYLPDGSVGSKQTASQTASGTSTTFTYDADGDVTSETHHYGCLSAASCTAGVTKKWYDGADRLVEVQQPFDMSDVQGYPWSTRYIYDLSAGGVTAYNGMGLPGYGNLVSTRELLSGTVWAPAAGQTYSIATASWVDVRATSFDALDRPVSSYEAALGNQPKSTNTYDGTSQAGMLSSVRLATNELKSFTYDALGRQTDVAYAYDNGVTPAVHQTFDADGRVTSRTTAVLGTETIGYDATGAVTSVTEPPSLGGGTIAYGYYADGLRSSAGYSDASQSYPAALQYAYRPDGKRDRLTLGNGTAFSWTYTAAGRLLTQSDPLTGTAVSPSATYTSNKVERPYYPSSVTYGPWRQGFDSYGRVASITLPVSLFAYTGSQFDLEDGVTQHTASGYIPTPAPPQYAASQLVCLQSSIRNEKTTLALSQQTYCSMGPGAPIEVNGAQFAPIPRSRFTSAQNWTLDARAGMMLHNTQPLSSDTMGSSFAYDLSGRLTQDFEGGAENVTRSTNPALTQAWCPGASPPNYAAVVCYSNGSRAKAYDAENRLHSETFTYQPYSGAGGPTYSTTSYGFAEYGSYWADSSGYGQPANIQAVDYGVTSHPMRFTLSHPDQNGATETRGWLWDGNDRFIECQLSGTSCQTPYLSIEGMADYDLAHGTLSRVNDRNRNGQVAMSRSATVFSGWSDYPIRGTRDLYAPCSANGSPPLPYATGGICGKQHDGKLTADGWTLDYETWQGVRTFDPAIGQWNTPDAYAGEVHDPSSQKPFMWNRNNPYAYADPSGYTWEFIDPGLEATIKTLSQSDTFKKSYEAAATSETKFTMRLVPNAEVQKTMIPGREQAGIAHTTLELTKDHGGIVRDDITIGSPATKNITLNAVASEVFNAGRVANEPDTFLKDLKTSDPTWGNLDEKKGAEGQRQIMSELQKKDRQ